MRDLQTKLDYADAVADWFTDLAESAELRGDTEKALRCACVAANVLCKQNRSLMSVRIESLLRSTAGRLPASEGLPTRFPETAGGREVCLHVLSEAIPVGGITSCVVRWMKNDQSNRVHNIALLSQRLPVPDALRSVVAGTGGSIYLPGPGDSLLGKAEWLKKLAHESATFVILHIDVSDVVCGAAFGAPGGPPVLAINYNAHIFWTGATIADLVVNIRGSALEELWTAVHRSVSRFATIPIPLPGQGPVDDFAETGRTRRARSILGIPSGACVIMTTGASFKYLPSNGLDFLSVCESVLQQLPDAVLLATGFHADARWTAACERTGSRIRTLGIVSQERLSVIHDAADVYIEGFPFGTTTSLLEAGLKGVPVVLAPAQCPPPYGSDGVALDDILGRSSSIEEYKDRIILLCTDPREHSLQSYRIRHAIARHHTGAGWNRYLDQALRCLPVEHAPQPLKMPLRTPAEQHEYWSAFVEQWSSRYEESLESAVDAALSFGVRPRLTGSIVQACEDHKTVRVRRTIPLPLLRVICDHILPNVPVAWARGIFRLSSFLCRASLLPRVWHRMLQLFGKTGQKLAWYEEYRQAHAAGSVRSQADREVV